MNEFEQRHINCFETLVGVVLGLVTYSIVMGLGIGLTCIPVETKFFFVIGLIVLIFATGCFVLYMISVAKDYSNTREQFITTNKKKN